MFKELLKMVKLTALSSRTGRAIANIFKLMFRMVVQRGF